MEEIEVIESSESKEEEQRVWSWGAGTDGQLGTGCLQDELSPQLLQLPFSVSALACGGAHVLALTFGSPFTSCSFFYFNFPFICFQHLIIN